MRHPVTGPTLDANAFLKIEGALFTGDNASKISIATF